MSLKNKGVDGVDYFSDAKSLNEALTGLLDECYEFGYLSMEEELVEYFKQKVADDDREITYTRFITLSNKAYKMYIANTVEDDELAAKLMRKGLSESSRKAIWHDCASFLIKARQELLIERAKKRIPEQRDEEAYNKALSKFKYMYSWEGDDKTFEQMLTQIKCSLLGEYNITPFFYIFQNVKNLSGKSTVMRAFANALNPLYKPSYEYTAHTVNEFSARFENLEKYTLPIAPFEEMECSTKTETNSVKDAITRFGHFSSGELKGVNGKISVKQVCTMLGCTNKADPVASLMYGETKDRRFVQFKNFRCTRELVDSKELAKELEELIILLVFNAKPYDVKVAHSIAEELIKTTVTGSVQAIDELIKDAASVIPNGKYTVTKLTNAINGCYNGRALASKHAVRAWLEYKGFHCIMQGTSPTFTVVIEHENT